jgi:hypothetical protein
MAERITAAALGNGLLVYPSTGCADGIDGDLVLLGPPFVISEEEMGMAVHRLSAAVEEVMT